MTEYSSRCDSWFEAWVDGHGHFLQCQKDKGHVASGDEMHNHERRWMDGEDCPPPRGWGSPTLAHVTAGRINGVEYTLCGMQATWSVEDHNVAAHAGRWCDRCQELDA